VLQLFCPRQGRRRGCQKELRNKITNFEFISAALRDKKCQKCDLCGCITFSFIYTPKSTTPAINLDDYTYNTESMTKLIYKLTTHIMYLMFAFVDNDRWTFKKVTSHKSRQSLDVKAECESYDPAI